MSDKSPENQEEKESGIITALRNYMMSHGGAGGASNRSYDIAMGVDSSSDTAKGYAMGGVVQPDMGDVPVPGENVSRETMPSPLPGIMASGRSLGAQLFGQYTPDKRNELYQTLMQQRASTPNAIATGLSSLGDAITRGYGQSRSDFLDKTQGIQKQATDDALQNFDAGQKGTLAMTQAGMDLGKIDPTSNFSKLAQEAYSGPLKKLGYSDEQISKMPASQIESISQVALKYGDIEAQKELKEATLKLQAIMTKANIANQKAEREQAGQKISLEREKTQREADEEASKHWLLHPILASQAKQRLAQGAGPMVQTSMASGPHGASVTQNGHTYNWNPETKQYE